MAQTAEHTEAHVFLAGGSVRNESDGSVRLVGGRCDDCGTLFFPSAHVCPECMSEAVAAADLANDGTLYSWSVVHVAPRGWNTPYIAGYVDLSDGVRGVCSRYRYGCIIAGNGYGGIVDDGDPRR